MATNTREKAKRNAEGRDKRPHASAKYIRISPSKVALVLDLIRGKDYAAAVTALTHTNKSACRPVLKVLNSAAANAENNMNIAKDGLFVAECWATQGPTMKRMMPRAKGRGDRIFKRTSHIKVILGEREEVVPIKSVKEKKVAEKKEAAPKKEVVKKEVAKKPVAKPAAKKPVAKKEGA